MEIEAVQYTSEPANWIELWAQWSRREKLMVNGVFHNFTRGLHRESSKRANHSLVNGDHTRLVAVIAAHNEEHRIGAALESLAVQTRRWHRRWRSCPRRPCR